MAVEDVVEPAQQAPGSAGPQRVGRRPGKDKDGGRALIDALTNQQRRNARTRGGRPAEPSPPAPAPPRLPRGSNASAQLDRAMRARSPATEPQPLANRPAQSGEGALSESSGDPDFDRSKGPAADAGKSRLFDPDADGTGPPRRRGTVRKMHKSPSDDDVRWTLEEQEDEEPYFHGPPPPPLGGFYGPGPHPHHHGYGPPHHFRHHGPPPPFGHRGPPPFHDPYGPPPPPHGPYGPPHGHPHGHPPRRSEPPPPAPGPGGRMLYDHRRDDPVRFQVVQRSTGNGDGARSTTSSTNQSGTTRSQRRRARAAAGGDAESSSGASKSTAQPGDDKPVDDSKKTDGSTSYVHKLKKAFKKITDLEKSLKDEEAAYKAREETRDMRVVGQKKVGGDYWVKIIKQHQQLAEAHRHFLDMSLDPRLPPSLHSLPRKYDIPIRLWQTAFHQLLERLRHALPSLSPSDEASAESEARTQGNLLLDSMTDFIYFSYNFYTALLDEPAFADFRSVWIEQLGDLARYRMAVAGLVTKYSRKQGLSTALAPDDADDGEASDGDPLGAEVSDSGDEKPAKDAAPPAQLDRGGGSVGVAALNDWDYEEQDTWRNVARDWYAKGIAETPANGRLHHHLALLSKGDEMRTLYHYVKSLTAPHPYLPARESVLPFFEAEHQTRRTRSDVSINDLFVHLHGMLFTKISLDDFDAELGRFIERLAQERYLFCKLGSAARPTMTEGAWVSMAVVNVAAVLQYCTDDGVVSSAMRTSSSQKKSRHVAARPQAILLNTAKKATDSASEVGADDDEEDLVKALEATKLDADEEPLQFRLAAKLCFSMLDEVLRQPLRPSVLGTVPTVVPYITVVLTFLGQVSQSAAVLPKIERYIPWTRLVNLFNKIPRSEDVRADLGSFKLSGSPLPEDWCMRGMDWSGKTLFGHRYFRPRSSSRAGAQLVAESELDALSLGEAGDASRTDGVIQADGEADPEVVMANLAAARWRRVAAFAGWAASPKARFGLGYDPSVPKFAILGSLKTKMSQWSNEEKVEKAAKAASTHKRMAIGLDEDYEIVEADEDVEDDDDDDANDCERVKQLKARRRELRAIIRRTRKAPPKKIAPVAATKRPTRRALEAVPGYTILVFDTNILVGMLSIVRSILDAQKWTIVIPLAVVTELDGLKHNPPPLGQDAGEAVRFLETSIRTQSKHLKVQTSRGNYLFDLSVRSEDIDFAADDTGAGVASTMDDLVLRAAIWQNEHFTNRLAIVNPSAAAAAADRSRVSASTAKVALVTFDRNLRLKARARGIAAADEKDIVNLLSLSDKG